YAGSWSVCGSAPAALLAVGSVGALAFLSARRPESAAFRLAFAAFWLAAGFVSGRERIAVEAGRARAASMLVPPSAGGADVIEGMLADFWSGAPPRARVRLDADRLWTRGAWHAFPAEVALFVSGQAPVLPVAARGDRVRATGHLELEDLPASDREIGLPWPRFRMSVKSAQMIQREGVTALSLLSFPNRWLFSRMPAPGSRDAAYERDVRGPLSALLLGRTAELDRGMVARYRRGGLYHLLVVSGLHVVLAAALVLAVLRLLRIEGKARDLLLLLAVVFFVLVGGANPPAVRAGLVVGIFVATRFFERPIGHAQAIGLSALILFLAAPAQVFSVGTVLTFAAVCGIALFSAPIRARLPSRPEWLFSGLAAALAAECATAPVLLWRFNVVAAGAWLTAPLTIPLSGALIAAGGALLGLYAAGIPAGPLESLFAAGSRSLEYLADRAAGVAFLRPTPPLWAVVLVGALLAAAAGAPRTFRKVAGVAAAGLFLVLALRRGPEGPGRGFSIEALDVGQGDAILLRWQRRAILVDGGGPFDLMETDYGRARLLPKLLDRGVTRLDAVALTHPHPDHALGLFAVLEELPVLQLWLSTGEDEAEFHARLSAVARRRRVPVRALAPLDVLDLPGGARLSVLHSGGRKRKADAINNQSLVALFERDGRSALLTGDAGTPTEEDLGFAGALSPVDVLKVGHHGSRTASSPAFVEALCPRVALLSCGRRNRYGHPAPQTLATLSRVCVPVLRTDARSDARVDLSPEATRLSWRGVERP
ncbi:MAG: DNA internalization-related competence protein ComEC/Rec2, partial [Thermoanaerobaculia bacterium]